MPLGLSCRGQARKSSPKSPVGLGWVTRGAPKPQSMWLGQRGAATALPCNFPGAGSEPPSTRIFMGSAEIICRVSNEQGMGRFWGEG